MLIDTFLLGMLFIAVIYDLKIRQIPNLLIVSALAFAMLYHVYLEGYSAGLYSSLLGFVTGISLLIIPFIMGGMGAGDVKLLGVVGALKGCSFVFSSFLWMALWGGVIALVILIINGRLKEAFIKLGGKISVLCLLFAKSSDKFNKLGPNKSIIYYPYALAIGLGVLSTFYQGWC